MTGATAIAAAGAGVSSSMAATVAPFANGSANHAPVTIDAIMVTVTGGTGPFTYLWQQVGLTPEVWTIGSPTGATPTFTGTDVADGDTATAYFHCAVTDSLGAHALSNDIQVNATATHSTGGA